MRGLISGIRKSMERGRFNLLGSMGVYTMNVIEKLLDDQLKFACYANHK